jgi:4-amino-4-deoxy-L-arabinose transferase-like glycosyltransferase
MTGAAVVIACSMLVTSIVWMRFADYRLTAGTDFAAFYEPVARNLVDGRGLVDLKGHPAVRYPPGYPFIVAAVLVTARTGLVSENVAFAAVAVGAMAVSCALLWWMARTIWPARLAWLAPALWMTYPLVLWLTLQQSTEVPFTAVFYGSLALFWRATLDTRPRPGKYFVSGLLLGAAMLIRPIAIGAWVVFVIAAWLMHRTAARRVRLLVAGALIAGVAVTVVPWEVWMWRQTGRIIALSDGGASSLRDGLTFALNQKRFRQGVKVPDDVEALMHRLQDKYDTLTSVGATAGVLWAEFTDRPDTVIKLFAVKALRSWFGTDSHRLERETGAVQAVYLLLALAGGWLCWRAGGRTRRLMWLVAGLVLYFWVMTISVLSIVRYMAPVMGLLFLLTPPLLQYLPWWKRTAK